MITSPIGHFFHVSVPGLVERAEHWLKRRILQRRNENDDDEEEEEVFKSNNNSSSNNNEYDWSMDRDLSMISFLLGWTLDDNLNDACTSALGIRSGKRASEKMSLGTYGCDSTMTFVVPTLSSSQERFAVSPELNALFRLGIVTLFMSLMPVVEHLHIQAASVAHQPPLALPSPRSAPQRPQDLQHFFSKLITHYGIVFPDMYGNASIPPSLGMLSYYAVGKWETASVGARLLLQAIIERMDEKTRLRLASRWSNKLQAMRSQHQSIQRWRQARQQQMRLTRQAKTPQEGKIPESPLQTSNQSPKIFSVEKTKKT